MRITQFKPVRSLGCRTMRLWHRVDNKLYRMSAKTGQEQLLYLTEAQIVAWLCRQSWAQRRYWAAEVSLVQRFLHETGLLMLNPALDEKQAIQQALLGEVLRNRWRPRLTCFQPNQTASMISVRGQEIFAAAYQRGKGVIVAHYHGCAAHLVWPWLIGAGAQPQMTIIAGVKAAQSAGVTYTPAIAPFLQARHLYKAHECLQQGGIVRILPDGLQGGQGIAIPFYQRIRSFRTGFAELALRTGAAVIPVSAVLDRRGQIEITFHPPLLTGDGSQPYAQQCEQIVKQYVAFLYKEWGNAPGNITVAHMEKHLNHPVST